MDGGKKSLVFYSDKCIGCKICETICAVEHTGMINPERSRIKVNNNDEKGLDVINICVQCTEAPCIDSCPENAISRNKDGTININKDQCTLCESCIRGCPYGGISLDKQSGGILICDFCGGNPACVKWCPTNAIQHTQLPERERNNIWEAHLLILRNAEKEEVLP